MDPLSPDNPPPGAPVSRRRALQYGIAAAAALAGGGALTWRLLQARDQLDTEIFRGDAPHAALWRAWQERGWAREALHYLKLGRNVQCQLCPNHCVLQPGDRSHCRNRVNIDGTLYTLAYANPCSLHVDPVEKKPLFHFHAGSSTFSLATAGCVFRCLNCQNWEISQAKPDDLMDPFGPAVRLQADVKLGPGDLRRLSASPEDVVATAQALRCPSISYTYSEPVAWYEYTFDTCRRARERGLQNILVTCGSIEEAPLRQLAPYLDAAHVDLKGFDEPTYRKLNSGRLQPILRTLRVLKELGVWREIINLVVPNYTDDLDRIKRMCGWLVDTLGPDQPLHFSRFFPLHQLTYLPQTPAQVLVQARDIAVAAGLRYVYVGNVRELSGLETTFCPSCKKAVVERDIYTVTSLQIEGGACKFCRTKIAGVWG
jgi:pyruvate formate lyase activating enzyme